MAADFADAAPGVIEEAFSKLFETVNNVTNRAREFKPQLTRLQSRLASLSPSFERIRQLNGEVGYPEAETETLIEQMKKGNELVLRCSKIRWWDHYLMKQGYAFMLFELEEHIESFFRFVDFCTFNARNGSEALAVGEDVHADGTAMSKRINSVVGNDDLFGGQPQHRQQNAPPPEDDRVTSFPNPTPPTHSSVSSSLRSEKPIPPPSPGYAFGPSQSTFSYEALDMATNGFSSANLLGEGGFGYVHKGVLPNGKMVAIKQLKSGSAQGEREFRAEVEVIGRFHHKHLVSLVGYCIDGPRRMLVYEFVPNGTLDLHLHGNERPTMNWATRIRIALGVAKALAYLHEDCDPKIIHRDIKASNILLDDNFDAKVGDFGLAKLLPDTVTHVSTGLKGTFGYLAPEYANYGRLTDKSDVFSFGVVLLELITGRRAVDNTKSLPDCSVVEWARPLLAKALKDRKFDALVDPKLQKVYNPAEMGRMVACADASVRHSAQHRPRIGQIVRALEGNLSLDDLNEGMKPGHNGAFVPFEGTDYDANQYKEEMEQLIKLGRETRYKGTGECSGPSCESAPTDGNVGDAGSGHWDWGLNCACPPAHCCSFRS